MLRLVYDRDQAVKTIGQLIDEMPAEERAEAQRYYDALKLLRSSLQEAALRRGLGIVS